MRCNGRNTHGDRIIIVLSIELIVFFVAINRQYEN